MSTDQNLDEIWNTLKDTSDYKPHNRRIQFEWSPGFCWWILPTIEINSSMKEIAFYFLCLSVYFTWGKL